ncbi:MAG: tyrosine-type recombinase/integrase [Pseudonocardiaceae bacterium]
MAVPCETCEWKRSLERAGVPERRLHDARHTAATVLLGVPDRAVMDVMEWAQVTMTKRYQHITSEPTTMIADRTELTALLHGH